MTRTGENGRDAVRVVVDQRSRAAKVRRGAAQSASASHARAESTRTRSAGGPVTKLDHADEIIASWRQELPDIAGLTLEVGKRTARLNALLDNVLGVQLARLGLTRAEYAVLATLRRVGHPYRLRPSELTASLLLSSGGMSNVIKRIVDAGYVRRSGDPRDGRSSWVELTSEGIQAAETAARQAIAAHKALLEPVPKAKMRALSDLLREVLLELGDEATGQLRSA